MAAQIGPDWLHEVAVLRAEIASLRARLERLEAHLGRSSERHERQLGAGVGRSASLRPTELDRAPHAPGTAIEPGEPWNVGSPERPLGP